MITSDGDGGRTSIFLFNWLMGLGVLLLGNFFGWSSVLNGGIGFAYTSIAITTVMYFLLARSIAALSVTIKKSGVGVDYLIEEGVGQYFALITAMLEVVKMNILISLGSYGIVYSLGIFPTFSNGKYVLYIMLYIFFSFFNIVVGKVSNLIQGAIIFVCLLSLLFYWIGMMRVMDFNKYALSSKSQWFVGDFGDFVVGHSYSLWLLLGSDELPLVFERNCGEDGEVDKVPQLSSSQNDPMIIFENSSELSKNTLSISTVSSTASSSNSLKWMEGSSNEEMLISFLTSVTIAVVTVTVGASSPPGYEELSGDFSPLVSGLRAIYGDDTWNSHARVALILFSTFCLVNNLMGISANQLRNLSSSGLLPSYLSASIPRCCGMLDGKDIAAVTGLKSSPFDEENALNLGSKSDNLSGQPVPTSGQSSDNDTPHMAVLTVGLLGSTIGVVIMWACGDGKQAALLCYIQHEFLQL